MGLLHHDDILKLHAAVISAQLVSSRSALLVGIDGHFVAGLSDAGNRADQILQDLNAMNETGELADGSMPLATWLANAVGRTRGRREEAVFSEARGRVRPGSSATTTLSHRSKGVEAGSHPGTVPVVHHHHGDVHMASTFTTNITGSTVGAFAQGDNATATGTLHVGASGSVTQEQHKAALANAQTALIRDQDALERIDDRLYEAFTQFLTLARKIQVEQQDLAETQAKMKETLDEVWAAQAAKGMKPQLLPKSLEVVKVLVGNPVMGEVTKKLLGG